MSLRELLSASVLFLVSATLLLAQTSKGIVAGTVRDSTGAVVSHANITITSQLTGETRNTTSNGDGAYRVEALNPSVYGIHIDALASTV